MPDTTDSAWAERIGLSSVLKNTRSTVLYGLGWLLVLEILATAVGSSSWFRNALLAYGGGSAFLLTVLAYLAFYWYFAHVDPDRLQSERYQQHQAMLKAGLIGSNETGIKRVEDVHAVEQGPARCLPDDGGDP